MSPDQLSSPPKWRAYLAALPEVDPPAAIWAGVLAARARSRRARIVRWSAAAGLALAVTVPYALLTGTGTSQRSSSGLDPATGGASMAGEVRVAAGLREIDDTLARAYAMQLGEAELQALWDARTRVLESATSGGEPLLVQL